MNAQKVLKNFFNNDSDGDSEFDKASSDEEDFLEINNDSDDEEDNNASDNDYFVKNGPMESSAPKHFIPPSESAMSISSHINQIILPNSPSSMSIFQNNQDMLPPENQLDPEIIYNTPSHVTDSINETINQVVTASVSQPVFDSSHHFLGKDGTVWNKCAIEKSFLTTKDSTIYAKVNLPKEIYENKFDCFNAIIDDDMLNMILDNTNKRYPESEPITITELKCVIGLLLLFGVLKKNGIDTNEIWSPKSVHHCDYATASMRRERFKFIMSKITFDDFDSRESRMRTSIKYFKFEEFFGKFTKNIQKAFTPGKQLCVDETLYSYRGRCSFQQYMPNKPAKYKLKYNSIVDAETAYCLFTIP